MTIRPHSQHSPFRALALEPRILLDAAMVETAKEVAQQSSESGDSGSWIDRPTLTATPVDKNLTVKDSNDEFPPIDLFNDVTVTSNGIWGEDETPDPETGETSGRPLRDLTITVSATGASHALVVDGTTIPLQSIELPGTTADNNYTYTIRVNGDTTTITIFINSSNLPAARTADGAAALIDSIAYQAQSRDVITGDISVSLKLNESNADGSAGNSTEGRITSTVHITRDSDLPVAPGLSTSPALEAAEIFDNDKGLPGADQVTYSANGKYAYTAGADTFATFSVDASGRLTLLDSVAVGNLGSVQSLVASSDGKSVYSMSTNGQLVEMSVNADGTLSHVGSYALSNDSSGSLAISADGTQVYVDGGGVQRGIHVYSRDTSTGKLLASQHLPPISMSGTAYDALNSNGGNYNGAIITIARSGGTNAKDGYSFDTLYDWSEEEGSITLSYRNGQIFLASGWPAVENPIATFVNTDGTLTITFTEDASTVMVNRVLNQISFQTSAPESITMALKVDAHTQNISLESSGFGLSPAQSIDSAVRQATVIQAGNYLYIVNNDEGWRGNRTLEVYQRNSDGTWSVLDNITQLNADGDWESASDPIAVSADGLYVYVSANGSGTLDVYQLNTTSGFLSPVNSINLPGSAENADSLNLSADGKTLYVVTDDGSVSVYGVSGSRLALQGTTTGVTHGDMSLSSDGLSLIIANGQGITRYSLARALNLGESIAFADGVNLSDNNSDKLADGAGNYKDASITITPSMSGGSFGFTENNGLRLADGKILLNGSAIASFTNAANGSLTITFTVDSTTALANQVLQQITYGISDATAVGQLVTLHIQASDGELTSAVQTISLRVNALPTLDFGVADGYVLRGATSETAYSFTLFPGLFSDADGDALVWSVEGLPEGLTFDPKTLTISGSTLKTGAFDLVIRATDAGGNAASLELTLDVAQITNRAPQLNPSANTTLGHFTEGTANSVTLNADLFIDADAVYGDDLVWAITGLPAGLVFNAATRTISGSTSAVANYTLTVSVTDESGKSAQTELTLRVISTDEANNTAPVLHADNIDLGYTVKGNQEGFSQGVYSLERSSDDRTLIVVGNNASVHTIAPSGNSTLYVYSRASDGTLTLVQRFVQGASDDGDASNGIEINGLDSASSAIYSADGKYVYLAGKNTSGTYTITALSVNADGTLGGVTTTAEITDTALVKSMKVSEDGKALYVLSSTTLYAYSIDANGTLALIDSHADGYQRMPTSQWDTAIAGATALGIDNAQGLMYVVADSKIAIYTINDDGSLALATTYSVNNNFMRSIAVSDSGYVYVASGSSNIQILDYDKNTNTVTAVGTVSNTGQVYGLTLSSDGTALYAGKNGGSILVFSVNTDGTLTQSSTLATNGAQALRYVMTSDGSSIYYGSFWNGKGLGQISAAVGAAYSEMGTALPFTDIELSDVDYDALDGGAGNYNGASITITRSGGAHPADGFGFSADNGLALSGGVISLDGAAIASVVSADGKLTIQFTADVSKATANAVLQQINYTNTSKDPGKTITLQVTAGDSYASGSIEVVLNVTEVNDAPTLTATPIAATYVSGAASGVRVFEDTIVSAVEQSQKITSLTLTVSGVASGEHETLTIDGKVIQLVAGSSTTTNGYGVSVTIANDVATVTVTSSAGIAAADSAMLVNGIAYANAADVSSGTRAVTLTAIKDNGGTVNGGVDTSVLTITAAVTLSDRNTAPSLSSNASQVTYTENGEAATPFSGTIVSAGEDGQTIARLDLTVAGLHDGQSEVLTVGGTAIALVDGNTVTTGSGYTVNVVVSNGTATVTVTSASGIPTADMATLIDGIAYANTSDDSTAGARELTIVSVQDNGGTANGGSDSTTLSISATIDVLPINDAPVLVSKATTAVYAVSGSSAELFSGTTIDVVESGQSISAITLTVSGLLNGRSETITVDNTRIALVNGSSVTGNGYTVTVNLSSDGTATVTITADAGIPPENAAALIDGMGYANLSSTYTAGERHFTLTVQDSGSVANGGSDTTTLETAASLKLENNKAPVLGSTPDNEVLVEIGHLTTITGLKDVAATAFSDDGSALYVVSSDGAIAVFSRDLNTGALVYVETIASGLASVSDVQFSSGNSSLYVLGNDGEAIAVFTRSSVDGSLTHAQVLETDNVRDFTVAADSTLYVVDGNYSGLLVYSQGDSGEYTLVQKITASANTEPYLFTGVDVQVVGNHVYVITNPSSSALADTLIVYSRNADGMLGDAVYLRDGPDMPLSNPLDMAVSADGSTIYVATAQGVGIFSFADGVLTKAGSITGLTSVAAIALAHDGANLYVSNADGISRYDVRNTSEPALLQKLAGIGPATDLSVAANGALAVSHDDGLLNLRTSLTDSLKLAYTEKGELLPAGNFTLRDADHDAMNAGAGNYSGASITISRSGGPNANDSFTLSEANGLAVKNGVIVLGETHIADFTVQAGKLTISFMEEVSTTIANQVLRQIVYSNTSADPGSSATLELTVRDAYGAGDSVELALTIAEINDAPTTTGTALNPSYVEGGVAVKVFEGSTISAVETGQRITELRFAIDGLANGASETLNVDSTAIPLVAGTNGTTTNGYAYGVQANDRGGLTLVISIDTGAGSEAASTLLNSITYANTSDDPTEGQRSISLVAVKDDGGTANGGSNTANPALTSTIDVKAVNNAPTLISTGAVDLVLTPGDSAVTLFSGTSIDTVEAGQHILSLTLSIGGLHDGDSETLSIAGQSIPLTTGNTTVGSYTVQVSMVDGTATVTIHSASGITAADAAVLVNGISYANNGSTPTEGTRSITLSAMRDSGGTDNGGSDVAVLAVFASVNITDTSSGETGGAEPAHNGYIAPPQAWAQLQDDDTALDRRNGPPALPALAPADADQAHGPSLQEVLASTTQIVDAAHLLNALLPADGHETSAGSVQISFADGQSSPLIVLAGEEGPALQAPSGLIAGQWQHDLPGNRVVFQLPAGLIASRLPVAAVQLRDANGRPAPGWVRLDIASGSIIATGRNAVPTELHIVVRTVDGQSVTVPVHISPPATALSRPAGIASNETGDAQPAAKPPLSAQLSQGATSDLLAQAQILLARLADGAVTDTRSEAHSV